MINITQIDTFDENIEIGPFEVKFFEFDIQNNAYTFRIIDLDERTQDLCLHCWFSKDDAYWDIVRFKDFTTFRSVQIEQSRIINIHDKQFSLPEDDNTIPVNEGKYFFNIQNKSGKTKVCKIEKTILPED